MTQNKSKNTPTRPTRVPASKPKPQMKPFTKVNSKFDENEIAKPTSFDTNKFKYAQETLVGEPTLHPPGGVVTSVGLGSLETITNYGSKPDV